MLQALLTPGMFANEPSMEKADPSVISGQTWYWTQQKPGGRLTHTE